MPHLEEEAEADPLVVANIASLLRINGLVNAGVRHVNTDPLPKGAGDRVGGVDPAVRVQHVLWYVLSVNTIDGVAHILPAGLKESSRLRYVIPYNIQWSG